MTAGNVAGTFDAFSALPQGVVSYDASVVYVPGQVQVHIGNVSVTGDFDGDLGLDCADVDALVTEIASAGGDLAFDVDGNGMVDLTDLEVWLEGAGEHLVGGGFLPGDANLDGHVDNSDFNVWNANKFTGGNGWCGGDFNADGFYRWFRLQCLEREQVLPPSVSVASVPEPQGIATFLIALAAWLGGRRR